MADLYPVWTRGGIPWCISTPTVEFVQGMHGPDGHHMTLNAQVRFSDFGRWKRAMLGWSALSQNNTLIRVPPEQVPWPQDASLPIEQQSAMPLYCTQIMPKRWWGNGISRDDPDYLRNFRGVPQPVAEWNNWPCPEWVECQVTFEAVKYSTYSDDDETWLGFNGGNPSEWNRFTVFREMPSSENEKTPFGAIGIIVDNAFFSLNEVSFRRGAISRLEMKWLNVPRVPEENIAACCGRINDAPFTMVMPNGETRTWSAGTLNYDTHQVEPVYDADGNIAYNVSYFLIARTDGRTWNRLWLPNGDSIELVRRWRNPLGQVEEGPPFESEDLTKLFRFTP